VVYVNPKNNLLPKIIPKSSSSLFTTAYSNFKGSINQLRPSLSSRRQSAVCLKQSQSILHVTNESNSTPYNISLDFTKRAPSTHRSYIALNQGIVRGKSCLSSFQQLKSDYSNSIVVSALNGVNSRQSIGSISIASSYSSVSSKNEPTFNEMKITEVNNTISQKNSPRNPSNDSTYNDSLKNLGIVRKKTLLAPKFTSNLASTVEATSHESIQSGQVPRECMKESQVSRSSLGSTFEESHSSLQIFTSSNRSIAKG
jgi:hypothetical protein